MTKTSIDIVGVPDIADRVGATPAQVNMWRHRKKLPAPEWHAGGSWLWRWSDVKEVAQSLAKKSRSTV